MSKIRKCCFSGPISSQLYRSIIKYSPYNFQRRRLEHHDEHPGGKDDGEEILDPALRLARPAAAADAAAAPPPAAAAALPAPGPGVAAVAAAAGRHGELDVFLVVVVRLHDTVFSRPLG